MDAVLGWSLEAAFDAAWPALKAVRVGDWLCKSAPGVSRRANSANPAGAHASLDGPALEAIAAVYARFGQPAYVRLPSLLGPEADRFLDGRGYVAEGGTLTLMGPLEAGPAPEVELTSCPTPEWLDASNRANGRGDAQSAVFCALVGLLDAPAAFVGVRRDGRLVATAYAAAHEGWLALMAVCTEADWRGRGLAKEAVSALMAWGAAQGAQAVGLQVTEDNHPARALYRRLGVDRELYRYHYRRAP